MSNSPPRLGFPPPLLSDRPVRLPIIWDHPLGFALEKPPGIQILGDNWFPRVPALTEAINFQARQGKGELERLGIGRAGARSIYSMEPDMSGIALFAKLPKTGIEWANRYGSEKFELRIRFVSALTPEATVLACDLPIARHFTEPRMVISNRTGKKSFTAFRRLKRFGRYSLWEASTPFYRVHQVPLHAFEVGLGVVGDRLYGDHPEIYLSQIKRHFVHKEGAEEASLYPGMAMYIAAVTFPASDAETVTIEAPPPKPFAVLLRQLERFAR